MSLSLYITCQIRADIGATAMNVPIVLFPTFDCEPERKYIKISRLRAGSAFPPELKDWSTLTRKTPSKTVQGEK